MSGTLPGLSSPKYTEPLRDTPQTITVVPQSVIQAQGATTPRDVLRNVPGITYQAGEGGGGGREGTGLRVWRPRLDGGSINLSTKLPHREAVYAETAAGGNASHRRGTLDVNQPSARGPPCASTP